MKMNIKSFFATLLALVTLSACTEPAIDDLTGKYPAPEDLTLSLLSQERVKGEKVHNFNLTLATEGVTLNGDAYAGSGNVLDIKFVGNTFSLGATTYSPKAADAAKNGNYIVGEGGSTYYTVENGVATPVAIESGNITVAKVENDYEIYGTIWLANAEKSAVKFEATANIVYEPFPEPTKLSQVLSVTPNQGILTINLAQEGISSTTDPNTWQTIWSGDGFYLALDIYSADGKLYPGTYKPSAQGGVIGEGEYGIGWDPGDIYNIGMVFENWGTCWWTVANGATSAQKIIKGDITVEKKGSKYTITYGQLGDDIWFEFVGAIEGVDPDAGQGGGEVDTNEYVELSTLLSATSNVANGTNSLTINMAEEGISSTTDPNTWQTVWEGEGHYLALDIYSADGKLYTGTYNANTTGGVIADGEFGIGWDPGDLWNIGMVFENWGTCWWAVADGATSAEKVLDGTVTVLVEGDNLVIKLLSTTANAKFTYPVADFKDGQGNAIEVVDLSGAEEDTTEYVDLVTLLSATSNVASGTNSLTINMAEEGISSTTDPNTWQTVWEGEGHYLALDIYSADGKLYTGTYNANTTGGVIADGEFGIGWDPGDLWNIGMVFENWGTCWWAVADGATSAEKVLDGEVDVLVEGDNLVIKLRSTTANAKFTYPVADFTLEIVQ
ncbi:MAG: hypothetical protein IKB37_01465 [Rikenellaceae bacterium]|nr:hypothetical protein [Rikenellaceae bacterium]